MATNIQSQSHTELQSYLEERLHAQFPAANNQEVANAVEVALGHRGYALHQTNDQQGQGQQARQDQHAQNARQDQHSQNARQDQNGRQQQQAHQDQNGRQNQQNQHSQNDQRGQQNREQLMHDNNQLSASHTSIASVRDAAISAAQNLSESSLRMAAVACAWASYAACCAQVEQWDQNQQRAARN